MGKNVTPFTNTFGEQINLQKRFHDEARMRYQVESLEELFDNDYELLIKYIDHHLTVQQPRILELKDYAQGDNHGVLKEGRVRNQLMADNRLVHNFGDYISTFIQGYVTGKDISVEYVDDKAAKDTVESINDFIFEVDQENNSYQVNRSLVKTLAQTGRAYDYVYMNMDDKIRIRVLDVARTFVIFDNTHAEHSICGVRYYNKTQFADEDDQVLVVEVAANDNYLYTFEKDKAGLKEVDVEESPFNQIQITEYLNNEDGIGSYETQLSKIDAYDGAQSDTANYTQDISDSILLITGLVNMPKGKTATEQIEWVKSMLQARFMHLKPPKTENGEPIGNVDAKFLQKSYDSTGSEAYKTRLKDDIHSETGIPNLTDEKFAGVQTGEAIRQKMFGLDQRIIDTMSHFEKSLRRRYELIGYLGVESQKISEFDISKLKINFNLNLPKALKESIEAFTSLGGELSNESKIEITGVVENVAEEIAKIETEKKNEKGLYQALARKSRMTDLAVFGDGQEQE